jgi:hypothetical protein
MSNGELHVADRYHWGITHSYAAIRHIRGKQLMPMTIECSGLEFLVGQLLPLVYFGTIAFIMFESQPVLECFIMLFYCNLTYLSQHIRFYLKSGKHIGLCNASIVFLLSYFHSFWLYYIKELFMYPLVSSSHSIVCFFSYTVIECFLSKAAYFSPRARKSMM